MSQAVLALEDGAKYYGEAFGASADSTFELVFNTSMTGYQEILTDPSYRGQGVLFTVPHLGNVGINLEDAESEIPQVSAVVVRALSPIASNWRSRMNLSAWLEKAGTPGISGLDTRHLTRKLREGGTLKAALSTRGTPMERLVEMARAWPGLDGKDMVLEVTCPEAYTWMGDPGDHWMPHRTIPGLVGAPSIVVYDFGAKRNILRSLAAYGAQVRVVPAYTPADQVIQMHPAGVVLSNGPGDPAGLPYAVAITQRLLESKLPLLGICLGHQLLGLALGGRTRRLKFGHHGGNHPVQDLRSGQVLITSQNHNYCVESDSLDLSRVEVTYTSLNDGSLEGMHLRGQPVISVQFHPEAAPGPHDASPIFRQFFDVIQAVQNDLDRQD